MKKDAAIYLLKFFRLLIHLTVLPSSFFFFKRKPSKYRDAINTLHHHYSFIHPGNVTKIPKEFLNI